MIQIIIFTVCIILAIIMIAVHNLIAVLSCSALILFLILILALNPTMKKQGAFGNVIILSTDTKEENPFLKKEKVDE